MKTNTPTSSFTSNTFLKMTWSCIVLLLGISQLHTSTAQQRTLVVKDTSASVLVINPDISESATIVLYSCLQNLVISSSIELLDTSYDAQQGEYLVTIRPNTAHRLTIEYPGFRAYELRIPPTSTGEARFYSVEPPFPFISGRLVIEATPLDANIQVQGISMNEGAVHLDLFPGNYPVRISKEGYDPIEFFAEIGFNAFNVQRRSLNRTMQPLTVTSNVDGAKVYFQGTEIGVTPITDYYVDQGFAELRIERPGYKPYVKKVDIRSDDRNYVDALLETHVNVLPSTSLYVLNESVSVENDVLNIRYELTPERKKYKVEMTLLGPDNQPLKLAGVSGDVGKNVAPGNHQVYWPIPKGFPLDGVKVQVNARPKSKVGWMIAGGSLGIGGGVALAVLSGWGGDNIVIDIDGSDGGGGGKDGGGKRHSR